MCIILAKNKGVKLPNMDVLQRCWTANSHGAGIAIGTKDGVEVIKGLMSWTTFTRVLERLKSEYRLDDVAVLMHFRIATTGSVRPANTHPYHLDRRTVFAHNGMLPYRPKEDITDSEFFAKNVAKPLLAYHDRTLALGIMNDMAKSESSKFAVLEGDTIHRLGHWTYQEGGVWYSNGTYQVAKPYKWYNTYKKGRFEGSQSKVLSAVDAHEMFMRP
jgi:glutamine phosphoribosylpyrophosphate amidotransferase